MTHPSTILQDANTAQERLARLEQEHMDARESSQEELKTQIHTLELDLRDKETAYQSLQEEQAGLHQQIQAAKVPPELALELSGT